MLLTNTWLRIIVSMQINAILFGLATITVLSVPGLAVHAKYLISANVALSFGLAPFLALLVFPQMRVRTWGRQAWRQGDGISGRQLLVQPTLGELFRVRNLRCHRFR